MAEPLEKVEIKFIGDSKNLTKAIESLDKATKKLLNTQAKIVDFNTKTQKSNETSKNKVKLLRHELHLQGKSFKDLQLPLRLYKEALSGNSFALGVLRKNTNAYIQSLKKQNTSVVRSRKGMLELGHSARQTGGAFSVLRSKLLLINFALGLGIRQMSKFAKQASMVQSMGKAFETLQGGVGTSAIALERLREATNGTMTSFDLFQQANNAMILGVTKNSKQMAKMFDMAQRLGNALGKDTRMSVESLITGIGRQSRLMLDNIGIIVKSEEAYEAYAKANNKLAKDLTDTEKKQAFFNATIASAEQKVKTLQPEVVNTQMVFEQLDTAFAEMTVRLGNELLPLFKATSEELIKLTDSLDRESFINTTSAITGLTSAYGTYVVAVKLATLSTATFSTVLATSGIGLALGIIAFAVGTLTKNYLDLKVAQKDLIDQGEFLAKSFSAVRESLLQTEDTQQERLDNIILSYKNYTEEIRTNQVALANAVNEEIKLLQLSQEERDKITKTKADKEKIFRDLEKEYGKEYVEQNKNTFTVLAGLIHDYEVLEQSRNEKRTKSGEEAFQKLMALENTRNALEQGNLESRAGQDQLANAKRNEAQLLAFEQQKAQQDAWNEYKANADQEDFERYALIEQMRTIENQKALEKMRLAEEKAKEENLARMSILANATKAVTNQLKANIDSRVENEIAGLKDTTAYQNATTEERQTMEDKVAKSFADKRKKLFMLEKMASLAEIYINTSKAVMKAIALSPATLGQPFAGYATATGAIQAGVVMAQQAPVYEQGGLIGGRRHSQGGTMIEAEKGEFVMSRSAVESIGVEAMNQINQGGGAGITVNVTAPLVDETVIDSIIPAIEKAQRLNLA